MKGPYERLKYDMKRVWECPVCGRRERTAGSVTSRFCRCQENVEPSQRQCMKLVANGIRRTGAVPHRIPGDIGTQQTVSSASSPEPDASLATTNTGDADETARASNTPPAQATSPVNTMAEAERTSESAGDSPAQHGSARDAIAEQTNSADANKKRKGHRRKRRSKRGKNRP